MNKAQTDYKKIIHTQEMFRAFSSQIFIYLGILRTCDIGDRNKTALSDGICM